MDELDASLIVLGVICGCMAGWCVTYYVSRIRVNLDEPLLV